MDRSDLTAMLAPVVAPIGLEVDSVDLLKADRRRLVRVRLDGDGPLGTGPDLDEIAAATKLISAALDQADMGAQPYVLEVSSRGVDAPLVTPAHYRRNLGRLVRISLRDGGVMDGRLVAVDDGGVTVEDAAGDAQVVAMDNLAKAVVQVEFVRQRSSDGH